MEERDEKLEQAEGYPIEMTVRIGPGILVEGGVVGEARAIYVVNGCIHKLALVASRQMVELVAIAFARGVEASKGGQEEGKDAEAPLRFDA